MSRKNWEKLEGKRGQGEKWGWCVCCPANFSVGCENIFTRNEKIYIAKGVDLGCHGATLKESKGKAPPKTRAKNPAKKSLKKDKKKY